MYSLSNAVMAALLSGALIIMGIMTLGDTLFPSHDGGHGGEHAALAYTIEVASAEGAAEEAEVEQGPTLAELLVNASAEKGARQFAKCKSCHNVDKGGRNGTGPNLYGILGRSVASAEGFRYSAALSEHGGTWDFAQMDAWLTSPKVAIPGNNMSFAGINKADQRADLIAYLNSNSDTPLALPAVVDTEVGEQLEAAVTEGR